MTRIGYSDSPNPVDIGAIGRVIKGAMAGGAIGAVGGGAATFWLLGIGALPGAIGGGILGALGGLAWGMKADPAKVKNRPITIRDPLFESQKTVFVSQEQWKDIKAKLASGVQYDELTPDLARQFDNEQPPAPAKQ